MKKEKIIKEFREIIVDSFMANYSKYELKGNEREMIEKSFSSIISDEFAIEFAKIWLGEEKQNLEGRIKDETLIKSERNALKRIKKKTEKEIAIISSP